MAAAAPAAANPAGGAAIDQVAIATVGAGIATAALLWAILGYRKSKKNGPLRRLATFSEKATGLPAWAALPAGLAGGSLLIALLGMYWDISLHIDQGRDAGPLANPAHYLILIGLYGVFAAGCLALALPEEKPGPAAIKHHARLVRPGRRRADRGLRRLRAARLPARRHVAPPLRPGRHALGPDAPDALRRRRPHAHRPGDPARRGHALPRHHHRPPARLAVPGGHPARRPDGRPADRPVAPSRASSTSASRSSGWSSTPC